MKRLYLLRHGQTEFNIAGITQGIVDSPLTEVGKNQALNARKYFENNNIKFDKVYCSPLGRVKETTKIVTDIKPIVKQGLIELNFGSLDGKEYSLVKEFHDDYTSIGGESVDIVGDRMLKTLTNIMEGEGDTILCVSHGTVGRSFYYKVIGEYQKTFRVPNCGILVFDYDNGKFIFKEVINPND